MNQEAPNYLILHSNRSSVILEWCATEAPLWRYWGARLLDGTTPPTRLRATRPTPPASLEFDQPLSIAPTFGNGWFGQSALLAHRDGQHFTQSWNNCAVTREKQNLCITLTDTIAKIRLVINMTLASATDMLEINSCLYNDGTDADEKLSIQWLAAATLPLPATSQRVNSYVGQWASEFQIQTDTLSRSIWRRENIRGRTSHDCFPAATVAISAQQNGPLYGAHLAWSGNHSQTIEWQHDGQYQWQLGEWLAPGEVQLQSGQYLQSPTVFAAFAPDGADSLAHCYHATLRALMPWRDGVIPPRPVHLNTWEAVYFDHNEADLMALATAAADVGVERFVLDDGWFHARNNDTAGLGDWWADKKKYPQGLAPLAHHVIAKGMSFGLWVEPEMVNPDSELFRAHPDWAFQISGRPIVTGRNQLVLDLTNETVENYLFDCLSALLTTLPISYLKWDMNRDITHAGTRHAGATHGRKESAAYSAYVHALYRLLARIRAAFPKLEIESCASGGGRIDYAILRYTHRVWVSDCNDALARLTIQQAALQWLPPEIIGSHVGTAPAHTTGRSQSLAFRAAVALAGHFGLEMDVRKLSSTERLELAEWIRLYRSLRDTLHQAQVWRGDAGDGIVWQVHSNSQKKDAAYILCIYRIRPTMQRWSPSITLAMLDDQCRYVIENLTPSQDKVYEFDKTPVDGAWLKQSGLPLPRMTAESALIIRLIAENHTATKLSN